MDRSNSCTEDFGKSQLPGFNLTIIRDTSLSRRLASEISFALAQAHQAWPYFKNDPIGFSSQAFSECLHRFQRTLARPHVLPASLASIAVVFSAILVLLTYERRWSKLVDSTDAELSQLVRIDLPVEKDLSPDSGVGAGKRGRVGFEIGKGEGSQPVAARSRGGGGGGLHSQTAVQQGRPPQPSAIPAPIPNRALTFPPSMPVAGIDIDPALWKKLPFAAYGDPRSKSTETSNGSGDGGGMGTGNGTGIGEGDGDGVGPGKDGNIGGASKKPGGGGKGGGVDNNSDDATRVFSGPQVDTRAHILSKPEPQYTEAARRNQISGTVILRVVFSSSGEVTNIRAMHTLPDGLTEKAIAAARRIQFMPAKRNGQPVSTYMQLEYNFNLY